MDDAWRAGHDRRPDHHRLRRPVPAPARPEDRSPWPRAPPPARIPAGERARKDRRGHRPGPASPAAVPANAGAAWGSAVSDSARAESTVCRGARRRRGALRPRRTPGLAAPPPLDHRTGRGDGHVSGRLPRPGPGSTPGIDLLDRLEHDIFHRLMAPPQQQQRQALSVAGARDRGSASCAMPWRDAIELAAVGTGRPKPGLSVRSAWRLQVPLHSDFDRQRLTAPRFQRGQVGSINQDNNAGASPGAVRLASRSRVSSIR